MRQDLRRTNHAIYRALMAFKLTDLHGPYLKITVL